MVLLLNKEHMRYALILALRLSDIRLLTHVMQDLMAGSVVFSRLMDEYGSLELEADEEKDKKAKKGDRKEKKGLGPDDASTEEGDPKKAKDAALMQIEERNTGAVTWGVYRDYLRFAGGLIWAPAILLMISLAQAAQGEYFFPQVLLSFFSSHAGVK
jgi:hypothetical protein